LGKTEEEVNEEAIKLLLGDYAWFFIAGFFAILFKDVIHNAVEGFMVFVGNDLNADDLVYLGPEERPARVVRMGIRKTIFYMDNLNGDETKLVVPNERLKSIVIKKKLPLNGEKKDR